MNPHKNLVHKQMTFKYYQHCKIWLGLIYLLTFILSAWWNTCKYLHFNMSFCACESRQFDSNDLSHKSLNKWWTSNKSMTWTLLDAYWRRQVNMACGSPSKRSGSVLDSSAWRWSTDMPLITIPAQRPGSKCACTQCLGEGPRKVFAAERTSVFPEVSHPAALLWAWAKGLVCIAEKTEAWMCPSPPKRCTSEFTVLKLNRVVVKTSIMGGCGVGHISAASVVTSGCQTGKTAVVWSSLKSPWPESRWSCGTGDVSSGLPCPGMSSSWYVLVQWNVDSKQGMPLQADRNASGSVVKGFFRPVE